MPLIDPLARVRAFVDLLPDVTERVIDGRLTFFVSDRQFAQVRGDSADDHSLIVRVRISDDGATSSVATREAGSNSSSRDDDDWSALDLTGDPDWTLIEDGLARSWELAAPRGLLEAGGR